MLFLSPDQQCQSTQAHTLREKKCRKFQKLREISKVPYIGLAIRLVRNLVDVSTDIQVEGAGHAAAAVDTNRRRQRSVPVTRQIVAVVRVEIQVFKRFAGIALGITRFLVRVIDVVIVVVGAVLCHCQRDLQAPAWDNSRTNKTNKC